MAKEWILNSAMNRFQFNFKRNVGAVAEAIRKCSPKDLSEWEKYYFEKVRSKEHIVELGRRLYVKITEVISAEVEEITEKDCIDYMYNLVINRTYDGYTTEIKTIYGQLQKSLDVEIKCTDQGGCGQAAGMMQHGNMVSHSTSPQKEVSVTADQAKETIDTFLSNNFHGYEYGEASLMQGSMMFPPLYSAIVTLADGTEGTILVDAATGKTVGLLFGDFDTSFTGHHHDTKTGNGNMEQMGHMDHMMMDHGDGNMEQHHDMSGMSGENE